MRLIKTVQGLGLMVLLVFVGCSSTPKTEDVMVTDDTIENSSNSSVQEPSDDSNYQAYQAQAGSSVQSQSDVGKTEDTSLLGTTVFFFDFDKSIVQPEAYSALKAHARKLANNSRLKVRLEGHADERGTREYNIALGERRGHSVARFLRINGVSNSQMEVVSYGEEKPADYGHNETSWTRNRRVELVYR